MFHKTTGYQLPPCLFNIYCFIYCFSIYIDINNTLRLNFCITFTMLIVIICEDTDARMAARPYVSVLIDQSTDVVNHKKMVVNAKILTEDMLSVSTHFLGNVKLDYTKCTADVIFDEHLCCLEVCHLASVLALEVMVMGLLLWLAPSQGLYSLRRRLMSIGIIIINLRRSSDRLRFIMGILIPVRRRLLSE